jgi:hypothetical protein
MRRRLPGPWVGLAAMFAVIANRVVRGLSGPIRMADLVIQGLACPCGKEKRKNRIRTPICGTYSPSSSALHLRVSILSAQQDLSAPSDRIIGPKITVPMKKITVPMEKITVPTEKITVPMEKITVPTEKITVPTEKITVPTEKITVPMEKITVPMEKITVPTEKITVPTEKIAVPTEKITVPTEKITVPMEKITVLTRRDNANHGILWDGWELWGNYGSFDGEGRWFLCGLTLAGGIHMLRPWDLRCYRRRRRNACRYSPLPAGCWR